MANNAIGATAIACAWPLHTAVSKARYHGGSRYGIYKKALNKAYPNRKHWNAKSRKGASCDVFSATCIKYAGADNNFPRGLNYQKKYLPRHPKKWRKIKSSEAIKGGDVQIKGNHIRIVVEIKNKKYIANGHFKKFGGTFGMIENTYGRRNYKTYRSKKLSETFTGDIESVKTDSNGTIVQGIAALAKTQKQKRIEAIIEELSSLLSAIVDYGQDGDEDSEETEATTEAAVLSASADSESSSTITLTPESPYYNLRVCQSALQTLLTALEELKANETTIEQIKTDYGEASLKIIDDANIKTEYADEEELIESIEALEEYISTDLIEAEDTIINWNYLETPIAITEEYNTQKAEIEAKYADDLASAKQTLDDLRTELSQHDNSNYTTKIDELIDKIDDYNTQLNLISSEINRKSKNYNTALNLLEQYTEQLEQAEASLETFEKDHFSDEYTYWNKNVIENPANLNFWLEFLDTEGELSQFNIGLVGDRPKVVNSDTAKSIYFKEIPSLLFVDSDDDVAKYKTLFTGYNIINISSTLQNQLTLSSQSTSIKDVLDDNLYQYGYCAEEINITTIPIYYLEPGEIITVYDKASNINGKYVISKITMPLTYNGTMQITATKVPLKLY